MGFCGGCGKQSAPEDKFCTGCGTVIKEAKISVMGETGQVIKEEFRESTAPPDAELTKSSHIAGRKEGSWLEYTLENILKFAGYQTMREFSVLISEETRDRFLVDVLATDPHTEIFVECKDYQDSKLPEKIIFEFIGQLDHYRKTTDKRVVGILAMSAKDDSKSKGYRDKLATEDAFLWDGSFIEHLQNKMSEVQTKDEFHSYITNNLNIDETDEIAEGDMTFFARCGFYTVLKQEYIGKKFDVLNIIDDIKKHLTDNRIKLAYHEIESIKANNGTLIRYLVHVDFKFPVTQEDIDRLAKRKKKGLFGKIRRKEIVKDAFDVYVSDLTEMLKNIYGINYVEKSKNDFEKIIFEGGRLA